MSNTSLADDASSEAPAGRDALVIARIAAGAFQGIVLYLLYLSLDHKSWPSTDPFVMAPLLAVFGFVPLLYIQGVGTMRGRTLALWTIAATAVLAGLAWYDIWRQWDPVAALGEHGGGPMTFALGMFCVVGLFIAQALIAAADVERRWIAHYGGYFDAAWKQGVQLVLAVVFVGVFWGVLWLGAVLFNLIRLDFLEQLLEKPWFSIPATTLAIALAFHATDVRAKLVAGTRTIALTLLAWLLPLMTLIGAGFVASLPFTGLEPLWATKRAAGLLLTAAAVLVILFNAAYQDGDEDGAHRPRVWRYAEVIASAVTVPLVLIAAYALWLRVDQYGWTMERIATAAAALIALCYALGYGTAALLSLLGGAWMQLAKAVNIATAFVILAILLAIFSPLADPARLAVASQVARLKAGAVAATEFDYGYLSQAGRYGREALVALEQANFGNQPVVIHDRAAKVLAGLPVVVAVPQADIAKNVTVYPKGRSLPADFIKQNWGTVQTAPSCLTMANVRCDAYLIDLNGDGTDEVIVSFGFGILQSTVFARQPDGSWTDVGNLNSNCTVVVEALRKGGARPVAPRWSDLMVGDRRVAFTPASWPPDCR
jgi:Domain of unknown function (DUF4153)